ncbi:MAG: S-layer homology domain-containing protein, partial [Bifidobacteriaceae bacterium]|nr:S-layer homology domain-containing protein [Bifidobacteriaceae bacterium]
RITGPVDSYTYANNVYTYLAPPAISTIDGKSSGLLYLTPSGAVANPLDVVGTELDRQGSQAGNITVGGTSFVGYLTDTTSTGAKIKLPALTDLDCSVLDCTFTNSSYIRVPVVIPTDDFGNSDAFDIVYVNSTSVTGASDTDVQPNQNIVIQGDNFKFTDTVAGQDVNNVSRVEICTTDAIPVCKDALFSISNANNLNVTLPTFVNGTEVTIRVHNIAGAVTENQGVKLTYQSTEYIGDLTVYSDPNTPADNDKNIGASWTNLNTASVAGYNVKLYNYADGKFAEKDVSAGATTVRFDVVFSGDYYVVLTPILSNGVTPPEYASSNTVTFDLQPNPNAPTSFVDIKKLSSGEQANILWLAKYGVTSGYECTGKGKPVKECTKVGENAYKPSATTSRAQMAVFFHRLAGDPRTVGTPENFSDISASPMKDDIKWLSTSGVTGGYTCTGKGKPVKDCQYAGDKVYMPNTSVSRAQMAMFMYAFASKPYMSDAEVNSYLAKFKDANKLTSSSERNAVAWLIKVGVTSGYSDGTFRPSNKTTRGQMATFMRNLSRGLKSSSDA